MHQIISYLHQDESRVTSLKPMEMHCGKTGVSKKRKKGKEPGYLCVKQAMGIQLEPGSLCVKQAMGVTEMLGEDSVFIWV